MSRRVLVGQFMFEANSFSDGVTTAEDFGDLILDGCDPETLADRPGELGAACRALEEAGFEPVPSIVAVCGPGPVLESALVDALAEHAQAAVTPDVEGCYLALHGAAASESDDDPEGTLLEAMRDRLGDRPLVYSLDLHAQLTRRMVAAADGITTYRTSPHVDIAETGFNAAGLLADALEGRTRPTVAMAGRPMLTSAHSHDSNSEPYGGLMRLCLRAEQRPGVLSAGLCTAQPWLDIPELGWRAVVTTDGDPDLAAQTAEEIIAAAWDVRHELAGIIRPSIEDALTEALEGPSPCIVSEASDSTNAGALGDSTEMLHAALAHLDRVIYLSTKDPGTAAAAFGAGEGAAGTFVVGRGTKGAYNGPIEVDAIVERLYDGEYAHTTPVCAGLRERPGPTALLRIGEIRLVVHSRRTLLTDPVLFEALGLDPRAAEVVQAKSPVSFRAGFARVSERMIVAEGSGPANGRIETLPYTRRPRPLYPFECPEEASWTRPS
jgi:microcystin degradation protein MlrC